MESVAVPSLSLRPVAGLVSHRLSQNHGASRDFHGGLIIALIAAAFPGTVFGLATAGVGGTGGLEWLLRFREDGPGVATVGLVALALFATEAAKREMCEFSMDRFAGTNLQPGAMDEATRNNVSGIAGAMLGILLLRHWRRAGSLSRSVVEPLASYFGQLLDRGGKTPLLTFGLEPSAKRANLDASCDPRMGIEETRGWTPAQRRNTRCHWRCSAGRL